MGTPALFYRKKEKKKLKQLKFSLESKFLVKRLFNSLNEGAEFEAIFINNERSLKLEALQ